MIREVYLIESRGFAEQFYLMRNGKWTKKITDAYHFANHRHCRAILAINKHSAEIVPHMFHYAAEGKAVALY